MIKTILIVDDDREMLLALKEGLQKYREAFAVEMAADGRQAVEMLRTRVISLVVTDLKMPHMDGFELLAYIMHSYPEIPVIIITGYSTSELERLALEGGAVGYIAKPFLMENLAKKILTTLRREIEGGTLHNVSSGMFLQLMEMEQKSCTIRLQNKQNGRKGVLFFAHGELFDARLEDRQGIEAAYEIFAWDQVNLSIQNGCALQTNRIGKDVQRLMLEALRRKDEFIAARSTASHIRSSGPDRHGGTGGQDDLFARIENAIGPRCEALPVHADPQWERRLEQFAGFGGLFDLGGMTAGYVDLGEKKDFILAPGENPLVLSVNPKSPREQLLQLITG